jgi:riboflavin kinase / FMN adenylyltransferase
MKIIRRLEDLQKNTHQSVVTIGNFDGVHIGHQSVLRQLRQHADELGVPAVVLTFEPLPLEHFSPRSAPARLTDFRQKVELLDQLSVDKVLCLRFGPALASLSAEAFVKDLLVDGLGIKRLIAGADFRFGRNREGNLELLQQAGRQYGFDVIPAQTFDYNGIRVSSSLVRGHLALGDFTHAGSLLGRPFKMSGRVIHGDKRGRELGYPTANMALKRRNCPLAGVYAVRVHGLDDVIYDAVASIGTRPVFNGDRLLLETFIFGFDRQIYGQRISVEFLKHLRDERDFPTVEALCEQMQKDEKRARDFLAKLSANQELPSGPVN